MVGLSYGRNPACREPAFLVHKSTADFPQSPVWRGISVIGTAFVTHRLDERANVLGWRELGNSMAEVKDVAIGFSKGSQDAPYSVAHGIRSGKQHSRIEVTLQGNTLTIPPFPRASRPHPW